MREKDQNKGFWARWSRLMVVGVLAPVVLLLWAVAAFASDAISTRLMNAGGAVGFAVGGAAVFAIFVALRQLEFQRHALDDQRQTMIEAHRLQGLARLREAYADLIAQASRLAIFIQNEIHLFTFSLEHDDTEGMREWFYAESEVMEDALYPLSDRIAMLDPDVERRYEVTDLLNAFRDICSPGQFYNQHLSDEQISHWISLIGNAIERFRNEITCSLTAEERMIPVEDVPGYRLNPATIAKEQEREAQRRRRQEDADHAPGLPPPDLPPTPSTSPPRNHPSSMNGRAL